MVTRFAPEKVRRLFRLGRALARRALAPGLEPVSLDMQAIDQKRGRRRRPRWVWNKDASDERR